MALNKPLTVDQGTLFVWDFYVRTDKTLIYNLTDYSVRGQVRRTFDSADVLITPIFDVSVILGQITMTIEPDQTTDIVFAGEELECVYDIEIYNDTSGDVKRIVEGTMTIKREVTR